MSTVHKFKLIKTTWLYFPFKYCEVGLGKSQLFFANCLFAFVLKLFLWKRTVVFIENFFWNFFFPICLIRENLSLREEFFRQIRESKCRKFRDFPTSRKFVRLKYINLEWEGLIYLAYLVSRDIMKQTCSKNLPCV